jgi:hypothetical protein
MLGGSREAFLLLYDTKVRFIIHNDHTISDRYILGNSTQ